MSAPDQLAPARQAWRDVDAYLAATLVHEDQALVAARESGQLTTQPGIEVTPNQGKFLAMLCRIAGARRVLEFGTLAGYSTLWLARAVGEQGHVTSLELQEQNAAVARASLERAGVAARVEIMVGPAADSARRLIENGVAPYDLVFIDADKPRIPDYLTASLALTRPGSVLVIDNVVRGGAVLDSTGADDAVQGVRSALAAIATDARLEATAIQTVGAKGWDGFTLIRRAS